MSSENKNKRRLVFYLYTPSNDRNRLIRDVHFRCLSKYIHLFDEATFVLSTDDVYCNDVMDCEQEINNRFMGIRNLTMKIVENNPKTREAKMFRKEVIDKLNDFDGLTFFAHGKGWYNMDAGYEMENLMHWIAAMYYFNLEYMNIVENHLLSNSTLCFGALKSEHPELVNNRHRWLYSGSFVWINGKKLRHYMDINGISVPECFDKSYAELCLGDIVPTHLAATLDNRSIAYPQVLNDYFQIDEHIVQTVSTDHYVGYNQFRKEMGID